MQKKIDIHSHIIYAVDDGAIDMEMSLEMIKQAYNQGIDTIVATPHASERYEIEELKFKISMIQEEISKREINTTIYLGQEIFYKSDTMTKLKNKEFLTLNNTRYILIEFNINISCMFLVKAIRDIIYLGYIPIIAHVERYLCLRKENYLEELISLGAYLQMNYSSIVGGFFDKDARWCKTQLKKERIHFLSTDMHNITSRSPNVRKSFIWLEKALDKNYYADIVYNNADKVLKDCIL